MFANSFSSASFVGCVLLAASLLTVGGVSPASAQLQHEELQEWNPRTTLCDRFERALGMESGALEDSALSASSSYNEQSVGPLLARLVNSAFDVIYFAFICACCARDLQHACVRSHRARPRLIIAPSTYHRESLALYAVLVVCSWLVVFP